MAVFKPLKFVLIECDFLFFILFNYFIETVEIQTLDKIKSTDLSSVPFCF